MYFFSRGQAKEVKWLTQIKKLNEIPPSPLVKLDSISCMLNLRQMSSLLNYCSHYYLILPYFLNFDEMNSSYIL